MTGSREAYNHAWRYIDSYRPDGPFLEQSRLKNVQAERAALIIDRLQQPGAIVLPDPVGTGKTVVALAAAAQLMGSATVEHVALVAPNATVGELWVERAAAMRSAPFREVRQHKAGFRWKSREFRVLSRRDLGSVSPPRKETLVIVDEAHRGLQTEGRFQEDLTVFSSGHRVLLVTATPFQLSASGLLLMLSVGGRGDGHEKLQRAVSQYNDAVVRLARACAVAASNGEAPEQNDAVKGHLARAQATRGPAHRALATRVLEAYPKAQVGLKDPPPLAEHAVAVPPTWRRAYDVARTIPELVGTANGDMFKRQLVSSSEAFRSYATGQALTERDPDVAALLEQRLGAGTDHPKVGATVDFVADRIAAGRHVLVFCVFKATRAALAAALAARLGEEAVVEGATNTLPKAAVARFRDHKGAPLALVLQDRFSESIDLDGGRPCLVHHDLPWNPARLMQRWGRVVRAPSGFQAVEPTDVFVPVLDVEVDQRLCETVKGRAAVGDVLLPSGVGLDDRDDDDPAKGVGGRLIPQSILRELALPPD